MWTVPVSSYDTLREIFGGEIGWQGQVPEEERYIHNFDIDTSVSDQLKLQPYPFQWIGANFLVSVKRGILADMMGLGKAVQGITALLLLKKSNPDTKAVIFCLASLKYQWLSEIQRFTDLSAMVIDGTNEQRAKLYEEYIGLQPDIVIINYELLYRDYDAISALVNNHCNVMIMDEAQKIKNWKSKLSSMFKGLATRNKETKRVEIVYAGLRTEYLWMLTGTPMENSPEELFNLFAVLDSRILGNLWAFRNRYLVLGSFKQILGYKNHAELHARVAPYMLRRRREEVEAEFPEEMRSDIVLAMTPFQARAHEFVRRTIEEVMDDMIEEFDDIGENEDSNTIIGRIALLLGIADSPELLSMSSSQVAAVTLRSLHPNKIDLASSPKLDWIEDYVRQMLADDPDSKVIIFTRSSRFQGLIVDRLSELADVTIINGAMNAKARDESRITFVDGSTNIMVSTDAGARGLNLQAAATLINADVPWNPAMLEQRCGRIVRIGSRHDHVRIINLYSRGSIDERIRQVIYEKTSVFNLIVEKTNDEQRNIVRLNQALIRKLVGGR